MSGGYLENIIAKSKGYAEPQQTNEEFFEMLGFIHILTAIRKSPPKGITDIDAFNHVLNTIVKEGV